MKSLRIASALFIICVLRVTANSVWAGPGDTITVQAFTFGSPQNAWFEMPSLDVNVSKILMEYTLKCNPAQSPACGEWDYLTYTYLYQHTGTLDSTLLTHKYFYANGSAPDSLAYADTQTFITQGTWNYYTVYDDTLSYTQADIGSGDVTDQLPFGTGKQVARTQYLWTASELEDAGLTAGDISGIALNFIGSGSTVHNLTLRMRNSGLDSLEPAHYENAGLTTVFQQDMTFGGTGWISFNFTSPFTWDGISNVVLDISYDNTPGISGFSLLSDPAPGQTGITTGGDAHYVHFHTPAYADAIKNALGGIDSAVTIAFWAYGDPAYEPQNGTTFEAVDSSGNRVLNSHTPWGDQNVYWDAGNDGGSYDRINKAAAPSDYSGNWTYWTFTKNVAAGTMKIYKNGSLWHSGVGLTRLMDDISHIRLGQGNWGGSESYAGRMDEFAVWNAELDSNTIQSYMYKDLDADHPYAGDLISYYHFDESDAMTAQDEQENANLLLVGASTPFYEGTELFRNFVICSNRPMIRFIQGDFVSHTDSAFVTEEVPTDPITVILFDPFDPTTATDTLLYWPAQYYDYTYNTDGTIADSMWIPSDGTLHNSDLPYYSAPFEVVNRYELARYITPYGIDLDLGDGFTWTYDVSDYRPLLHDSVNLSAGNWQELLDVKFLFIEGTPPRDVHSVTNLWSGGFNYGLTPSYDDLTPPKTITLPDDAENTRVKVRVTGHGFGGNQNCSEFCAKDHYLKLNGSTIWTQNVWRNTCGLNPVYPQGGTWVYDRSNWCPGAEVGTYDFELTPYVDPGETVTLDYAAEDYTWNGEGSVPYYQTEVQLITYGAPNFSQDAELDKILSPSDDDMWSRQNPICSNPVVRIRNTGADTLTSLDIQYGISGYDEITYHWTGSLAFMETEDVTLPSFPWTPDAAKFEVTISQPNGGADAYSYNNHIESSITVPVSYPADLIIEFRTNNKPSQDDLYLTDASGNIVFQQTTFLANTTYKDTVHLSDGCYDLLLTDAGGDGISFWANSDGSGYFRIKDINGLILKTFNPDFGSRAEQQFTVGYYTDIQQVFDTKPEVQVYPNPADAEVFLDIKLPARTDINVSLINITGLLIYQKSLTHVQHDMLHVDLSAYPPGIYIAEIRTPAQTIVKKFVISR